ncbi:MAG: multiprotein-bridging factor 1 family protein [Faecousia sp.]
MYNDQRVITIAREARGWTQAELGENLYAGSSVISKYERGVIHAPWDLLYGVMPELREMRKNGCVSYCDSSHLCRLGRCKYGRRGRPRKRG